MKKKIWLRWTISLLIGVVACFVSVMALFFLDILGALGPPLSIKRSGSSIVVHVETLGEYPTTIRHLSIVEAGSGRVVLDLVAKAEYANTGATQTRNFSLVPGKNSTHLLKPGIDSFEVRVPESGKTFNLQPGIEYRLKAWNGSWIPNHRKFSF